ncbi:MAG: type IIA DNA topoisomerase subunit B [Actinomycetia bacterium]|nr:type IIA DNA topoisomerase subunit B [Actinomycetes bacterium]MCP4844864.1 type IIA DNA topoisomerase subunit B [Actinomycetes bacterium]
MSEQNYSAENLQVLEGLDAVRKRPGMYIGSTDSRGLQHCMWEIIDNSVDEALAGHCDRIEVVLHDDDSVEVIDNGRGIPTDVNKKTGMTGVELVFTKLHAGGKFGDSGYKVSGGLHGVGASVVNALSSTLIAEVDRAGKTHRVEFDHGNAPAGLKVVRGAKPTTTGSRVRYWADRKIFLADAAIDLDKTHARARQTAFLVPGLTIAVVDARTGEPATEEFCFDGGVGDYVGFLAPDAKIAEPLVVTGLGTFTESVPVLDGDKMVTTDVEREMEVDIALQWGTGFDYTLRSFVNIVETTGGGTHVVGMERAIAKQLIAIGRDLKSVKAKEENPSKDDCTEGLTAVVVVKVPEPQFEGQTKEILGTAAATKVVAKVVNDALAEWATGKRTKSQAKKVTSKIAEAARTRRQLRAQRDTIRRKKTLETSSLPAKLADCRASDLDRTELFIVEGDSAMGTAKSARDSETQALLPIRGKILNTQRSTERQMLENTECAAIINALGAGSGRTFDESSLRYGKLIILTDADVDGSHIRCLLLTLCYQYLRPLLEAGRVYAAVPPLHRISVARTGEHIYTFTEEEKDEVLARLEDEGRVVKEIQRYKGLGEMDADQLSETTMDPSQRLLRQMSVEDAAEMAEVFEMLMGSQVEPRKMFIVDNAVNITSDDLDV